MNATSIYSDRSQRIRDAAGAEYAARNVAGLHPVPEITHARGKLEHDALVVCLATIEGVDHVGDESVESIGERVDRVVADFHNQWEAVAARRN